MAEAKHAHEMPFFVRQAGLEYGPCAGAITGHDKREEAQTNCDDRNRRAKEMGLKAEYEIVAN